MAYPKKNRQVDETISVAAGSILTIAERTRQLRDRVHWYIMVRWFFIIGLALPGILAEYLTHGSTGRFKQYVLVCSGGLLYNLFFYVLAQRKQGLVYFRLLVWFQIFSDIVLASYLLMVNGGLESRTVIIYVLPIIMAGAMFKRRAVIITAVVSAAVYDSLIISDYEGIIKPLNVRVPALHADTGYLVVSLAFYSVALLMVTAVAQFVIKLLVDEEERAGRATIKLTHQNEELDNAKNAMLTALSDLDQEKAKLQELTKRDQALIYSIGDSIIVTDEYGRVTRVNTVLESLLGYSESELLGKSFNTAVNLKSIDGGEVPPDKRAVFEALATGQPVNARYQFVRKDGSTFVGEMTAAPYLINDQPAGVVVTLRDASQQFAIDKAKTEFVSLASHQLRTPLSTINWYLEMVLDGDVGKLSQAQSKYLNEVYAANQRMVSLVNALLNVSRLDLGTFTIEPKPVDLKKTVENVLGELRSQIQQKHLKVVTTIDDDLKPYSADPTLALIIFQNLISNAVKYTPAKGQVTITVTATDNKLRIVVSDNGYGIPKHQHSKIFTKLFRADNVVAKDTDGTGLGLYIVKAIVDETGGHIGFVSKENAGTTFTINLPLSGMRSRSGTKGLTPVPGS